MTPSTTTVVPTAEDRALAIVMVGVVSTLLVEDDEEECPAAESVPKAQEASERTARRNGTKSFFAFMRGATLLCVMFLLNIGKGTWRRYRSGVNPLNTIPDPLNKQR